jgi:hypothetical protein
MNILVMLDKKRPKKQKHSVAITHVKRPKNKKHMAHPWPIKIN